MTTRAEQLQAFGRLLDIMDTLREKCPWDKVQTLQTLRPLTIEETYELSEALLEENLSEVKKELGDVLLHLVFYAKIASEQNAFDIGDALQALCEKLIVRHPHIYADVQVESEQQVKENWEKIKIKTGAKSVLGGVPKHLPALVKAFRIQEKVGAVGFDWDNVADVRAKIDEELAELTAEIAVQNKAKMEQELGDVLFSIVNYARFLGVNPETALERTNKKFIRRFTQMEEEIKLQGKEITQMELHEIDTYWNEAKKKDNE